MRYVWLALACVAARTAHAQPAAGSDAGSAAGSAAGSDAEPTFEPTRITATPAQAPAARNQPLILDELHIGSSERVELFLFGDASARAMSGDKPSLGLGVLGLQVAAHLTPSLVGRTEIVLEPDDMMMGTHVDMSRMYLEYRHAGWTVAAGSTHSELGYWNNAFHHGRWLQLTIDRPQVIEFEDHGGMLPIHHIGITVEHAPPRGQQGLDVALAVGNGHGATLMNVQSLRDDNLAKSLLLRVGMVGLLDDTLRLGANVGFDKIAAQPMEIRPLLPDQAIYELITGLYLALRGDPLVVYSEVYDVLHTANGMSWNTVDGFVVAGYRVDQFIPYVRVEARRGDGATDPYYNPDPMYAPMLMPPLDFTSAMLGLHYDLGTWSALKLEVEVRQPDMGDADKRVELNWSFGR